MMNHKIIKFFLWAVLAIPSMAFAQSDIETSAKQAIVVDYETGTVLYSKNAQEKMPTSSMSKVITAFVIFDALEKGQIALDDEFMVSEKAWRMGGSKMFVEVDKAVKVEDLLRGVIIQSGNDATVVLAEGLAGSEDRFADKLNETAKKLGMTESHFANASGWPDPNHYSTARDLAILARALIANFPDYYGYYGEREYTYNNIKQPNRNPLLYRNIGADGVKTGHTEDGGYGLIGSGQMDGRRVIIVLNGMESQEERAQESAKMLQWGLDRFKMHDLMAAGDTAVEAPLVMAQGDVMPLVVKEDLKILLPRGTKKQVKVYAEFASPVVGPVTQGQELGKLVVEIPGLNVIERPLYAGRDAPALGFFARMGEKLKILSGQG